VYLADREYLEALPDAGERALAAFRKIRYPEPAAD